MGAANSPVPVPSLLPRGEGHRFVVYGDSCSGVPRAEHESTFAQVNEVVRRLEPGPEFLVFAGDEVAGLTADVAELRRQWEHWSRVEMSWLAGSGTPVWHSTGNHTTYDIASEAVFRDMLPHLPRNGPAGQEGLSYWVRRGDLALVFVNTLWSGLGGEGHVETDWLRETLDSHSDARHRIVVGHHPAFAVNGYSGPYQRTIGPEHTKAFWDTLVDGAVLAYVCSHILAFDIQVHRGVLQLCTAGAGTAHRMPEGVEYLHCVQAALDQEGLRYQVLDTSGMVRETLTWPFGGPAIAGWVALPRGEAQAPFAGPPDPDRTVAFRFTGTAAGSGGAEQTLLAAHERGTQAALWIGLRGPEQRLAVVLAPEPGRSPHYWIGPRTPSLSRFDYELLLHSGMGPGGILFRAEGTATWSSLPAASPWGPERITWPTRWAVGYAQGGPADRSFRGDGLRSWTGAIAPEAEQL